MERDFMGLGSQVTVKEETPADSTSSAAGYNDSVTMRNSGGAQWSFSSSKVSAVPQFLSFQSAPEDNPRKSVFDPVSSPSFMSISNADAFDSGNRTGSASFMQKSWMLENESGSHHRAMAARPAQQHIDAFPVGSTKDVRMFPLSNLQHGQPVALSLGSPVLQSHFASPSHSGFGSSFTSPIPVVPATASSFIGTTELRNAPKFSGSSAQLTIFYAGSVCVYDEVSPEQAQAIMSMARRSGPTPTFQMQPAIPTSLPTDHHFAPNRFSTTPPRSTMPSPISVSSSTSSEPGLHVDPPSIPTSSCRLPQARIPQARKASLARFLEKRKERATNASPYAASKEFSEGEVVCA